MTENQLRTIASVQLNDSLSSFLLLASHVRKPHYKKMVSHLVWAIFETLDKQKRRAGQIVEYKQFHEASPSFLF